ncbi:MAG: hypothetical protein HOP12_15735 [Candidatus Eisenbacteria bacterium]|uniref:Uncharacterized protein n=1 Tax=Eiseniibacteriota bacterium TaxID=2212470 RepID=A0A849SLX5_UNCEI|nr:hypothetical protein [Candidatus Eisenbacteria bacterium]
MSSDSTRIDGASVEASPASEVSPSLSAVAAHGEVTGNGLGNGLGNSLGNVVGSRT